MPTAPRFRSRCSSRARPIAASCACPSRRRRPRAETAARSMAPGRSSACSIAFRSMRPSNRTGSSRPSRSRVAVPSSRSGPRACAIPSAWPSCASSGARPSSDRRAEPAMSAAADRSPAIPGWYGKLPSLGDFAGRRLPAEFVQPWDAWLQSVLHAARAAFGQRSPGWYLAAPTWRFVLLPGLVGASGWAGVLIPSVDRVSRQFPLTVAVALPSHTAVSHAVFEREDWFENLEEAALAARDRACGPDDFDRALEGCAFEAPEIVDVSDVVRTRPRLLSADAVGRRGL